MSRVSVGLLLALSIVAGQANPQSGVGKELVINGSFEEADPSGKRPAGWSWPGRNAEWAHERGNRWIRLRDDAAVGQVIELRPEWWKIEVSVKVKCTNVKRGKAGWHDARVAMMFADEKGNRIGPWPPVLHWTGTFDWRTERKVFKIPKGAKRLHIQCAIFRTKGVVEFDDLSVKVVALWPKLEDAKLPEGVVARWDLESAHREETATRGRVCINGLWQFHPAGERYAKAPPPEGSGWGWLKVPGSWAEGSGIRPIGPEIWEVEDWLNPARSLVAWYRREVEIPREWRGRRILLCADNVVREAEVFVNGRKAGALSWPDGRVDITALVRPGGRAELALKVSALPVSFKEWRRLTEEERSQKAAGVRVRGLCGDLFIESEPLGPRISSVLVAPSVRSRSLGLRLTVEGLEEDARCIVEAEALFHGRVEKRWRSKPLTVPPNGGPLLVSFPWPNPKLWDVDRPNLYTLRVRLLDDKGRLLDEFLPLRFGFREVWIEGRNVCLNGRPLHIRAFDLLNPTSDGGLASKEACLWALRRFRDLGMNFVYLAAYNLDWGRIRYLDGVLEAADELGFLLSLPMPHVNRVFSVYRDPKKRIYWERMARWIARKAGNHPSVIAYAMNHNCLGHPGDQNPRFLDGSPIDESLLPKWLRRKREVARWTERFVKSLDPTRLVYHHQSGNFGDWITLNCYLNWVPIQERMDWLRAFGTAGKKPLFLVEFGMPHQASFQRHRGAPSIWRNEVHAEPLNVEFCAIYFGDEAYELAPENIEGYERMAEVYKRKGPKFFFWEVFGVYWAGRVEKNFLDVKAEYTKFTWPAFRTWGLTAVAPWDWGDFGRPPERGKVELGTDWGRLQTPGLKPDFVRVDDWYREPPGRGTDYTILGRTLRPLNQDLLAYIAGRPEFFTSRDHIFEPGERVRKQFVFVNDTPKVVAFRYRWRAEVAGRRVDSGEGRIEVGPGRVVKVPISFAIPNVKSDSEGRLVMTASPEGDVPGAIVKRAKLSDTFEFRVIKVPKKSNVKAKIGLLDPKGITARALRKLGVEFVLLDPGRMSPPDIDILVVGREALSADEAELWRSLDGSWAEAGLPPRERLSRPVLEKLPPWLPEFVEGGGRVLICEQTERVLSRWFGFRTAWPGTRRVFVRCPWHPAMRRLDDELLSLWRGSSTLTIARTLMGPVGDPVVDWLGFPNTRVWKWGNYATVASVVIEKPHFGDFLPLADCEFDLAYTPLLEYRSGRGIVLFCQLDISERTEEEPVVRRVWANLLSYLANPLRKRSRRTLYIGGDEGRTTLDMLHVRYEPSAALNVKPEDLLIVGPGAKEALSSAKTKVWRAVREGAIVFCLGLGPKDLQGWLPFEVELERAEVLHTPVRKSDFWLLRGLGPSEFHWRGKVEIWAVRGAPERSFVLPTGVVAAVPFGKGWLVLCQMTPEMFDEASRPYLRLSRQRCAQMLSRLLANCGASFSDPLLRHLSAPRPVSVNLAGKWRIKPDPKGEGEKLGWHRPEFDDRNWLEIEAPGFWEGQTESLKNYDGIVWYRKKFRLPKEVPNEDLELVLGAIDDEDWTYVNGRLVGHIGRDTNPDDYWAAIRRYKVPREFLLPGSENVVAIKVLDLRQAGGIAKGPIVLSSTPRWLSSYYINAPIATDDPYRYCRW